MAKKKKAEKSDVMFEVQLEIADISAKLRSIGSILQDSHDENEGKLYGVGLILSELSAQMEKITQRIDPASL